MSPSPIFRVASAAAVLAVIVFGAARTVRASDPIGLYALVEHVAQTKGDDGLDLLRIDGVFALSRRDHPDAYGEPTEGYLFFRCPPDGAAVCKSEWADLAKAIGSGKCAGFGSRWEGGPYRVRPADEAPTDPASYGRFYGVVLVEHGPCESLKDFRAGHPVSAESVPAAPALPAPRPGPGNRTVLLGAALLALIATVAGGALVRRRKAA